jgi:hypothetical protein
MAFAADGTVLLQSRLGVLAFDAATGTERHTPRDVRADFARADAACAPTQRGVDATSNDGKWRARVYKFRRKEGLEVLARDA